MICKTCGGNKGYCKCVPHCLTCGKPLVDVMIFNNFEEVRHKMYEVITKNEDFPLIRGICPTNHDDGMAFLFTKDGKVYKFTGPVPFENYRDNWKWTEIPNE